METKNLNDKIKNAFTNAAPDDPEAALSLYEERKGNYMIQAETKKSNTWIRKFSAVAAVFVLIVVGCFGFLFYNVNYAVDSTISLDINPSIEIRVNQKERVLDVIPLNEDGRVVIGNMDLSGSDLDVAVNALIGAMLREGFGVTVISKFAVREELRNGMLTARRFAEGEIHRSLNFIYLAGDALAFAEEFIAFCRARIRNEVEDFSL